MDKRIYDGFDGWREENGFETTKGTKKHYEGGCEYDPTAEAILEYMRAQELKKKQEKNKDLGEEK
ncbi:MAG: hypothetical protein E7378_00865 [Clostridiales bacterium]|nr:hypothetical protein [Clostridiales bacterium]